MDLASYFMYATVAVFAVGAAFALAWSISAGHWRHLNEAAMVVLEDDTDEEGR